MKITVIGCGRWGSFIARYLDSIGHEVSLYGKQDSEHMIQFLSSRKNSLLTLPSSIKLTTSISSVNDAEVIVISINSQGLRGLMQELIPLNLQNKIFVLCMKGIEISTGKRLSEVVAENTAQSNKIAVWLGPGHVQDFLAGIPNCMVIDSADNNVKKLLVDRFSSSLIRFYYGEDFIGSEIGGAAKNVIGIAAGMLDGLNMSTLKGALMARGTKELAGLIQNMGGRAMSAYGLCLLGDFEATLFSPHSHNRAFGEAFVRGQKYDSLAEGYYTSAALMNLSEHYSTELPICHAVYNILYEGKSAADSLDLLFSRSIKQEFSGIG